MAQRLIDANALKDYFQIGGDETSCEGCEHLKARGCYEERLLSDFCSAIDEQPTIDAEPVRHGKWITCTSSEHWKCSECGCRAGYWFNEENSGIDSWEMDFSEWLSDYCPCCGARMDKE